MSDPGPPVCRCTTQSCLSAGERITLHLRFILLNIIIIIVIIIIIIIIISSSTIKSLHSGAWFDFDRISVS